MSRRRCGCWKCNAMEQRISVSPPASVANLGSGFDTMGIALSLCNSVQMQEWDCIEVVTEDGTRPVLGEQNLIWRTVKEVYQRCGRGLSGLRLVQSSPIPQARGLGSSSACIAAGVVGANRLLGNPLSIQEQLDLAAGLEGHPDNVVPAMLGGYVTSVLENGRVFAVKKRISDRLRFCAFVPDFELLTEKARAALPEKVPHKDAVYNLSRAALMAAAFCEGRTDLFAVAAGDRLHQPYRLPLIPGARQVMETARALGALAVFISGAGPTIMAICDAQDEDFPQRAAAALAGDPQTGRFTPHLYQAQNEGMFCEEELKRIGLCV